MTTAGCSPVPTLPPGPADLPQECHAPTVGVDAGLLNIDSQQSWIRILTYSDGRLARLGHNHVIVSQNLHGFAEQSVEGAASTFVICLPVQQLIVDDPQQRARGGEDFAREIDPDSVAATRRNMLSEPQLDAETHAWILVSGRRVDDTSGQPAFELSIRVQEHVHLVRTSGKIERTTDGLVVSGELKLRQSDLGIEPYTALFGALEVRDELDLSYHITLTVR